MNKVMSAISGFKSSRVLTFEPGEIENSGRGSRILQLP